jgi:hypothetical protein
MGSWIKALPEAFAIWRVLLNLSAMSFHCFPEKLRMKNLVPVISEEITRRSTDAWAPLAGIDMG